MMLECLSVNNKWQQFAMIRECLPFRPMRRHVADKALAVAFAGRYPLLRPPALYHVRVETHSLPQQRGREVLEVPSSRMPCHGGSIAIRDHIRRLVSVGRIGVRFRGP